MNSHVTKEDSRFSLLSQPINNTLSWGTITLLSLSWGVMVFSSLALNDIITLSEQHTQRLSLIKMALGMASVLIGVYLIFQFLLSIQHYFRTRHQSVTDTQLTSGVLSQYNSSDSGDKVDHLTAKLHAVAKQFERSPTSLQQQEEKKLKRATTDELTGAFNRLQWPDTIATDIDIALRGHTFSVVAVDIDDFKRINDMHGHPTGDEVLKTTVEIMRANVRSSDAIFRIGGEEFLILLRFSPAEHAVSIAEKIRRAINDYTLDSLPSFTASFGVTEYISEDDAHSLLTRADAAMYLAKSEGKNCVKAA